MDSLDSQEHSNFISESKKNQTGQGGLDMFRNRLRKNKKEMAKRAKQNSVQSYRLYDKDIPQVPVVIDLYKDINTTKEYLVFQYFRGPFDYSEDGNDRILDERISTIKEIILEVFQSSIAGLYVKLREKKKGSSQYEKLSQERKVITIQEGNAKILVNLSDYLDTGIFLDHRPLRLKISRESSGKNVLNLFCYTGAFTVHAGLGGAKYTASVDLSNTYLEWAEKNLLLNQLNLSMHQLVEADIIEWVKENREKVKYDTIILDPPTFSNSKKTGSIWDLPKDCYGLIQSLIDYYLSDEGVIYFSTNFRKFQMESENIEGHVEDISEETIPFDIREKKIHRTWKITKKAMQNA
jgi:23S rRNA G2069 N7-methylase RlmK/C1962 C5-methylase RlmI